MPFVTFPLFVAVEKYPPAPIIGAAGTPGLDPDHTNTAVATGDPGVAGLVILVTHGVTGAGFCASGFAGFAGFDADATAAGFDAGFDACAAGFAGRAACAAVGLVTCPPVVAVENPCVAAAPIGATAPPPGLAPVAVATAAAVGLDPPNGAADAAPGLGPVAVATAAAVVAIVAADADAAPTAGPATAATVAAGP